MKKEKVLLVHNYYQISGGEDTVVVSEKKMLEENGHEVIFYYRDNAEIKKFNILQKFILIFTAIFSLKTYKEVRRIIKEEEIDIVHVHNTLTLISPAVYYAALRCKVPIVQTIHNFRLLCPGASFYRNGEICEECINKGLKSAIKNKCYRGSYLQTIVSVFTLIVHRLFGTYKKLSYICLTEFNKQKLLISKDHLRNWIEESGVFVKPNFVCNNREIIPYHLRKNQFVFVGRLDKLKGIDLLLNAWIHINDSALIICGTGPEEEWCKCFINQNKLQNVKMMGFIPNGKALDIIAESKALILPTQWYEGFPMTILEGWSCGTPVIGSNIGNVGDIINDGITGVKFQHDDVKDLVKAVNLIKGKTFDTRVYLENKYNIYENYRILLDIYKKISQ